VSVVIRPVRPDEHDRVGALTLAAYDAIGTVGAAYREHLTDIASRIDDESGVLVAVDGIEVLGTVTVVSASSDHFEHGRHGDGGFRMLAVAPEAQGRGIGGRLLGAALDHARGAGWRRIAITSMSWMDAAHAMYDAAGFARRPDLDVRFVANGAVGCALELDLVPDAQDAFPAPGPVPDVVPMFVPTDERPTGC